MHPEHTDGECALRYNDTDWQWVTQSYIESYTVTLSYSYIELHWVTQLHWVTVTLSYSCIELHWVTVTLSYSYIELQLHWVTLSYSCIELHWVTVTLSYSYIELHNYIELHWVTQLHLVTLSYTATLRWQYNHCDKKKRTRTPYRPLFEAPETTVFQEWQNKAQLQYSRVAEGKNCEAQNSNFCVKFCTLLSHSYHILSMLHLYEPKGRASV